MYACFYLLILIDPINDILKEQNSLQYSAILFPSKSLVIIQTQSNIRYSVVF